jgi:hypothetical protein
VTGCHGTLISCYFDIMVLNMHAPTKGKTDDIKDSFYEEINFINNFFSKYCMYILLARFQCQSTDKTFSN